MARETARTAIGELHKHPAFASRILRRKRDVIVYLPPGYDLQPQRRFPALYLQDGQNLFEGATSFVQGKYWRVAETTNELIAAGQIRPLIIVGIDHAGPKRAEEYTPIPSKKLGGGKAERYGGVLLKEQKPLLEAQDRKLPRAPNTGLGGASLGGPVSVYLWLRDPPG